MVSVRLHRLGTSVLTASPTRPAVTRESAEAAIPEGGAQEVRLHRLAVGVLVKSPTNPAVQRESAEIAVVEGGAQPVRLHRLGVSVLLRSPAQPAVGRETYETAVAEGGTQPVRLHRLAVSVFGKVALPPVVPRPLAGNVFFLHNWVDECGIDTAYTTDVQRAPDTGAEERRSLGQRPDRVLELSWLREGVSECYELQRLLRQMTDEEVQVPLYPDAVELIGATALAATSVMADVRFRRYFVGARVLLFRHSTSIIEEADVLIKTIASITASTVTFTTTVGQDLDSGVWGMVPLLDCEVVLEPSVLMHNDRVGEVKLTVREIKGSNSLPPLIVGRPEGWWFRLGLPVFEIEPNWIDGCRTTYLRYGNEEKIGRRSATVTDGTRYNQKQEWNLSPLEREDWFSVASFFDSRRGRCLPFFAIDREFHLTVVSTSTTGIFVEPFGEFADFETIWTEQNIAAGIVMKDGTVYLATIFSVTDNGSTWRLTLTETGSVPAIDVSQIDHFAPARISRFESDSMSERWKTNDVAQVTLSTIETQQEKDVDIDPNTP